MKKTNIKKYAFRIRNWVEYSMIQQYLGTYGYPFGNVISRTDLNLAFAIDKVYMYIDKDDGYVKTIFKKDLPQKITRISYNRFKSEFMGLTTVSENVIQNDSCDHVVAEYLGFTESFKYCIKCDKRLD